MKTRNVLMLTAATTPKNRVPNLKRTELSSRLEEYKQAFKFYLSQFPLKKLKTETEVSSIKCKK